MREYIIEAVKNTSKHFRFGGVPVHYREDFSNDFRHEETFLNVEEILPDCVFQNLQGVDIGHHEMFDQRDASAIYKDGVIFISSKQDNMSDLADDIIHELAHHVETLYPEEIYGDHSLKNEFLKKRGQLEFELRSEGYWTGEYDFKNLKYDQNLDVFLYKRVGEKLFRMVTAGLFVRPYASVSLREYWATGFEHYFLGDREKLKEISPALYEKVKMLHK